MKSLEYEENALTVVTIGLNVKISDPFFDNFLTYSDVFASLSYGRLIRVSLYTEDGSESDEDLLIDSITHHPDLIIVLWHEGRPTNGAETLLNNFLKANLRHVVPGVVYASLDRRSSKTDFHDEGVREKLQEEVVAFGHKLFSHTVIKERYWTVVVVKSRHFQVKNLRRAVEWSASISKQVRKKYRDRLAAEAEAKDAGRLVAVKSIEIEHHPHTLNADENARRSSDWRTTYEQNQRSSEVVPGKRRSHGSAKRHPSNDRGNSRDRNSSHSRATSKNGRDSKPPKTWAEAVKYQVPNTTPDRLSSVEPARKGLTVTGLQKLVDDISSNKVAPGGYVGHTQLPDFDPKVQLATIKELAREMFQAERSIGVQLEWWCETDGSGYVKEIKTKFRVNNVTMPLTYKTFRPIPTALANLAVADMNSTISSGEVDY